MVEVRPRTVHPSEFVASVLGDMCNRCADITVEMVDTSAFSRVGVVKDPNVTVGSEKLSSPADLCLGVVRLFIRSSVYADLDFICRAAFGYLNLVE